MSASVLALAFVAYLLATLAALLLVASSRDIWRKLAVAIGWLGLAAHTLGLGLRWFEAGLVELAAAERALGHVVEGSERLAILLSHPPFTNMYESLVFFAWSMVAVTLVASRLLKGKRFWVLGVVSMVFADLCMGLASLTLDQSIAPLVPALQSWWLFIHVITAFLAYACFLLAAVGGVLYLVRDGLPNGLFGRVGAALGVLVVMALAGGVPYVSGNLASVALLGDEGICRSSSDCRGPLPPYDCLAGHCVSKETCSSEAPCPGRHTCRVLDDGRGGRNESRCVYQRMVEVSDMQRRPLRLILPGATFLLAGAGLIWLLALVTFSLTFSLARPQSKGFLGLVFLAAGALFLVTALGLGWREAAGADLGPLIAGGVWPPDVEGSTHLSLRSAPYRFALALVGLLVVGGLSLIIGLRKKVEGALPDAKVLDALVLKSVQVGFPLMTLTIVTGAVWAHYAWGRYWGWDPKETWSLVAWIVYALYLHVRSIHGWRGRKAALVAIVGFAVVIFTFLGVNMGLTGAGLHTYGGPGM